MQSIKFLPSKVPSSGPEIFLTKSTAQLIGDEMSWTGKDKDSRPTAMENLGETKALICKI